MKKEIFRDNTIIIYDDMLLGEHIISVYDEAKDKYITHLYKDEVNRLATVLKQWMFARIVD